MKKNDLIIVIIFILFLIGPNVVYFFIKDKMDTTNYENKNLYSKPDLTFNKIMEYPKNYENYFNDHLPFKNEIRNIRASVLYNLKTSSNSSVIIGKDGWLFYNSAAVKDGNAVADYRNIVRFTDIEKQEIKNSLVNTNNYLQERDIKFYVYIAPNKENVYSDYMPSMITRDNESNSKTEDLINYLNAETNLEIVYPKNVLIENRKKHHTYYKYDTHWNSYGAYLGTIELMKIIDSSFEIPKINVSIENTASDDLARMNALYKGPKVVKPIISNFYDDKTYKCESDKTEFIECESDNPLYNETILFVGDSFRNGMSKYLFKLYKKSIFVHRNYYNEDFIKKYNPNLIIYEVVERKSINLKYTNKTLIKND